MEGDTLSTEMALAARAASRGLQSLTTEARNAALVRRVPALARSSVRSERWDEAGRRVCVLV
jgi:hypothetical protein